MNEIERTVYETARKAVALTEPPCAPRIWYERREDGGLTGRTFAVIWEGDLRHVGISVCADDDQFSRKRGRQIAAGRAWALCMGRFGRYRYTFNVRNDVCVGRTAGLPPALWLPKPDEDKAFLDQQYGCAPEEA